MREKRKRIRVTKKTERKKKQRKEENKSNSLGKENKDLQFAIKEVKWMHEEKQRKSKENNIIIKGLNADVYKTERKLEEWIFKNFDQKVELKKVWTFKITRKDESEIAIGAVCGSWEEKFEIIRNKNKIKEKIYIDNDLTAMERRSKNAVYKKAKEIQEKTGVKPKMKYNKVETDIETWYWNERNKKWFRKPKEAHLMQPWRFKQTIRSSPKQSIKSRPKQSIRSKPKENKVKMSK